MALFSEAVCPVCGYYCLGLGGAGCIDKPALILKSTGDKERMKYEDQLRYQEDWHRLSVRLETIEARILRLELSAPPLNYEQEITTEPCPFCGSKKVNYNTNGENAYWVVCRECDATGPDGQTSLQAIAKWNHAKAREGKLPGE